MWRGLIPAAGGCLDDIDARLMLAFVEALLCQDEDAAATIDGLYQQPPTQTPHPYRAEQITAFLTAAEGS